MEQEGISRYLVSVGGALNSRGMNGEGLPWRVAIQKPTDKENAVQAVVDINGHGISTSGSYRNYYESNGTAPGNPAQPPALSPSHKTRLFTLYWRFRLRSGTDAWCPFRLAAVSDAGRRRPLAHDITKEGDSFKTWMSPQFKSFLVSEKN